MNSVLKNILAVIAGFICGSILNSAIVCFGGNLVGLPEGVIAGDSDSLEENAHLFGVSHFIAPFLAHALGTLLGAFVAAKLAASRPMILAFIIGFMFLFGGLFMAIMFDFPVWMDIVDILLAYLPFAWLGGKWGSKN